MRRAVRPPTPIVALAAVTAGTNAYGNDLWRPAAIVGVSVLSLWIAHVYAHGLGESLALERRIGTAVSVALNVGLGLLIVAAEVISGH